MRLVCLVALVVSMSAAEIERAQSIARARDSERQQFHAHYVVELSDPAVTRIEIVTPFRRLVMICEDHVLRGDWMFTRGVRAAEEALAPFRGITTFHAVIRFNPLNAFVEPPPYALTIDGAGIDTQLTPDYSVPFKARDGRTLTSLVGAHLEANVPAGTIRGGIRTVAVLLQGKPVASASFDFSRLD